MNTADNDSPETIRDDLRKLLRCPLSEECKTELEPISEKLYEEWGKICGKYEDTMTDGLIRHVSDPESLELSLTMETELGDLLEYRRRITEWIQNAREEFSLATIAFRAKVADRKTYPKHYPPQKYSKKQVCSLSQKKNESVLYTEINEEHLSQILPTIYEEFYERLLGKATIRIVVDCLCPVGCSNGQETHYLAFDLSGKVVHAYPIQDNEIRDKGLLVTNCDVLQGVVK